MKNVEIAPTPVGSLKVGPGAPLLLLAGPCALESEGLAREVAEEMKAITGRSGHQLRVQGFL